MAHAQAPANAGTTQPTAHDRLSALASLTPRDLLLLDILDEHQVLTTDQLARLAFPSHDRAQQRLRMLARRGVLARFRSCTRPGSDPWHYALGPVGAAITAAGRGAAPPRPAAHAARLLRLARNPRLSHLLGCNEFFVTLAHHARTVGGCHLEAWWGERRSTNSCGGMARPDAYGVWRSGPNRTAFFLEHDTGTEPLARLVDKLAGYQQVATGDGSTPPVLFWLPSARREHGFRALLNAAPVPVATATADNTNASTPAGAVWLPAGPCWHHTPERGRLTLATLGAYARVPHPHRTAA